MAPFSSPRCFARKFSFLRPGRISCVLGLGLTCVVGSAGAEPVSVVPALTPLAPDIQVNTYTTAEQVRADVAAYDDGFVVVWQSVGSNGTDSDASSIQARLFEADGAPVADQFQVNTYTPSTQWAPAAASWDDGRFVVVWSEYDSEVRGRLFEAGATSATDFIVESGVGAYVGADVAANDSSFLVVWPSVNDGSSFGIAGRRFDTAGAPVGASFVINSYTTSFQTAPKIATAPDQSFVVVWESRFGGPGDEYGIVMRRLDSLGTPLGTDVQVNSYTTDSQYGPALDVADDGTFVVAWTSGVGPDADTDRAVVARRFDASGAAVGDDFELASYLTGSQDLSDVRATPDGGFVAVWSGSVGLVGDPYDGLAAARYASDGSRVGAEFLVNSNTSAAQDRAALDLDAAGNLFAAWESYDSSGDDDDGRSVQARVFQASADVTVSVSVEDVPYVQPATDVTFTLVVSNDGPDPAAAVHVVGAESGDLTFCYGYSKSTGGATGAAPSWQQFFDETLMLPLGSSVTYSAVCSVDVGASGVVGFNATVTAATSDPDASDNAAEASVQVADLFVDGFESGDTSAWSETEPAVP